LDEQVEKRICCTPLNPQTDRNESSIEIKMKEKLVEFDLISRRIIGF